MRMFYRVEMYIGFLDGTWGLDEILIPEETPDDSIRIISEREMLRKLETQKVDNVAFVGVYHYTPDELSYEEVEKYRNDNS